MSITRIGMCWVLLAGVSCGVDDLPKRVVCGGSCVTDNDCEQGLSCLSAKTGKHCLPRACSSCGETTPVCQYTAPTCTFQGCTASGAAGAGGNTGTPPVGGASGSGTSWQPQSGVASIKFCHILERSDSSLVLTLDVNGTKTSVSGGNCAPTNSCLVLQAGTGIPVTLLEGSTTLYTANLNVEGGVELMIKAVLDEENDVVLESHRTNGICSGGKDESGAAAKFCNLLYINGEEGFLATLNLGSTTFTAMSGTCTPIGSCTSIASGTELSVALMKESTTIVSGTFPSIDSGEKLVFFAMIDPEDDSPTVASTTYDSGICSVASDSPVGSFIMGPMSAPRVENFHAVPGIKNLHGAKRFMSRDHSVSAASARVYQAISK